MKHINMQLQETCYIKDEKNIEILANYEPKMHYVTEWWKNYMARAKEKR